jgi:MFS family permease
MSPATRLLVAGALALALSIGIGRFFYTPMLPLMQAEYGFNAAIAGLIASANFAGYLLGSLAASLMRPGPQRLWIFRIGVLVCVVTTLGMGATDDLTAWLVLRFVQGFAAALVMIATAAVVAEALVPVGDTALIGWMFAGVGFGIVVSGLMGHFAGALISSSGMWYLAGALCVVMTPYALAELGDRTLAPRPGHLKRKRREPRPLALTPLLINYTCEGLGYSVFATFIVAIVKSRPGLEGLGDWVWVIVGLSGAPSTLMWAMAADRIGYSTALMIAFAVQIVGVLLPAFSDSGTMALVAAIMFGGTFMGITMLTLPLGRHGAGGRGFALLTAGWGLGQMVGPYLAGLLVASGSDYRTALIASAVVLAFGLAVLILAVLRRGGGIAPGPAPAV